MASRLVPTRLRPHVLAFYAFVRLADDIADDPMLEPEAKIAQLDALERALVSGIGNQPWLAPALALKASLTATSVSGLHARQMLQAFRRDAQGGRCRTWSDLLLYCRYSANPVGRYLLELHGEGLAAAPAADALCTALQILNHIQDCRSDWVDLGRCYLPTTWFRELGGDPEQLVETTASAPVRAVLDRTLDQVDLLLRRAEPLPRLVRDRGLRMESAVILRLAQGLSRRLRRGDPLSGRIEVGMLGRGLAALHGIMDGLLTRPAPRETHSRGGGGSTFYWAMRLLPGAKRRAMFAVYGFCRQVDDLADEPGPLDAKRAALTDWRRLLDTIYAGGKPKGGDEQLLSALAGAVTRHKLPRGEFDAIIDGMIMDLDGPIRAPDMETLKLYCRRVAGAVGMLSVRIFGINDGRADAFAQALGEAMQLTNILRDLREDADLGRLYLPQEVLQEAGIDVVAAQRDPSSALSDPRLASACARLAEVAEGRFTAALALLPGPDRRALWPAVAMMHLYRRILRRMTGDDWLDPGSRIRLGRRERLWVAMRCALGFPPPP